MELRSTLLFFLALTSVLHVVGQAGGKVLQIEGVVVDRTSQQPIPFVVVDLLDSSGRSVTGSTDFDGRFLFCRCSPPFGSHKASLRVHFLGYETKVVGVPEVADVSLRVELTSTDTTLSYDKEALEVYRREHLPIFCGTEWLQRMEDRNPRMRHCDGTIKLFKQIPEGPERWCAWQELEP